MGLAIQRRRGLPAFDLAKLKRRLRRLMQWLGVEDRELSVCLTDDPEVAALNHRFRQKTGTTDVLSFSQLEGEGGDLHPALLGDVVISVPQAQRQARRHKVSLLDELSLLLIHGLLHLLGYEHEGVNPKTADLMFQEQQRLMLRLCKRKASRQTNISAQ